ncbi:MAG TPA: TonB-dependent receptor [Vicinamibacterales bacterium]|nr:TonB-dependent receptor [Vicinamibacterales bacterium]
MASLICLFPSGVAFAQTGAIAGVVKDASGLVLPGVTVEASSPALIEKVRTAVTDGSGEYKIIALPPGVYTVTFSLTEFNSVKRDGIELTTDFTANVNGALGVGGVEETLTVSAATPVVDVQNVVQQRTISDEVIAAIPSGRADESLGVLIPGATLAITGLTANQDVGGSTGDPQSSIAIHGGRGTDYNVLIDGIPANQPSGFPNGGLYMDTGAVEEVSIDVGAVSAERSLGGVSVNNIPKSGSDRFAGTAFVSYGNDHLQANNVTPELIAAGFVSGNHMNKLWDVNPSFGGPIRQAKLWFYLSTRAWGYQNTVGNLFYSANPAAFKYTPDLSRPAIDDSQIGSASMRLTWQVTPKNIVKFYTQDEGRCICHAGVGAGAAAGTIIAPEAASARHSPLDYLAQATWAAAITNRWLLEAGMMYDPFNFQTIPVSDARYDQTVSVTDTGTGMTFRSAATYSAFWAKSQNYRAALSYVPGSHAVKVGFTLQTATRTSQTYSNSGDISMTFLNGVPKSLTEYTTPYTTDLHNAMLGLYAQDQWKVKRFTLNAGLRFDHLNESIPATNLPAVQFVGARNFAGISDVPNWNDLNPRLGAVYDLFGTGKTAVKVSLSRYVVGETQSFSAANHPVTTSVNSVTRTWNDVNGNFTPDCNLANPGPNGECGAISNANFGKTVITTSYDDAIRLGWGVRPYNWETSVGVQHELLPRVSLSVNYFRRWFGNYTVTENLATTSANYDPFCVTAPVNPQLPGGGGYKICGLYDVAPSLFGKVNNLVTSAGTFGNQWEHYNGLDVTSNARLSRGLIVQGGLNVGRDETNSCFVVNSPQQLLYCDVKPPFQPQVKLLASVPLAWGLTTSGTFQSLPGPQIAANQTVTNAQIAPSLGRNLAAGANGTAVVNLIAPGTSYGDRLNQLDFRLSKTVRVGRTRIQGNFDLYNALNASPVLLLNNTYGANWKQPTQILPGRMFKFGAQVSF